MADMNYRDLPEWEEVLRAISKFHAAYEPEAPLVNAFVIALESTPMAEPFPLKYTYYAPETNPAHNAGLHALGEDWWKVTVFE